MADETKPKEIPTEYIVVGDEVDNSPPKIIKTGTDEFDRDGVKTVRELRVLKNWGFFGVVTPITVRIPGTSAATAANYTAPFFIADRSYEIIEVRERHETAGSDGSAVTVDVYKVPSGTAPASGTSVLTTTMNLKATANTNQSGSVTATISNKRIARGDSLALVTSGTLTSVAGVTVSVLIKAI